MDVWVEHELAGCEFPDQRLKLRLGKVLSKVGQKSRPAKLRFPNPVVATRRTSISCHRSRPGKAAARLS